MSAAIGLLIFFGTLLAIVIRPRRVSEGTAAGAGALLMLLGGYVRPREALSLLAGEWNVYGFFLGLMAISALADQAGVFEALALRAARWGGGDVRRLYVAVFLVGVLTTTFLSNDATVLLLTPMVYALVTRARLQAMPFMFACTFIADTASFALPVSNPINVLVLDAFGVHLGTFLRYLLLPSLFCITFNVAFFTWRFRHDLQERYEPGALTGSASVDRTYFRLTLASLVLIAAGYVAASALNVPLSLIALCGATLLLAIAAWCRRLDWALLRREISWPVFLFVSGMFVLVRGVEDLGFTREFGAGLLRLSGGQPLIAALTVSAGGALGANLINNLPMALVLTSALQSARLTVRMRQPLVYASILGADLGPNLTTVGSLATMLWVLVLRRRGLEVSTLEYFKLGVTVVPVSIVIGALLIWARL